MTCVACQCNADAGAAAHALVAALRDYDLDRAIALGLLDATLVCAACSDTCRAALGTARRQREAALAARERHHTRNARLQRRERERTERRKPAATPTTTPTATPALPPAAAAALARAKAKAAGPGRR